LTVLMTKIRPSKPRVGQEYMATFMNIFSTAGVAGPAGVAGLAPWHVPGPEHCDNPPRKIPYYCLNQSTLVIK
jgi:hypothetical protein